MRLIDADALSAKFNNDNIKGCFRTDADGVIRLLADAPTVEPNEVVELYKLIPQTILDEIKEELKSSKRIMSIINKDSDIGIGYKAGYISAISYIEGVIASEEIKLINGVEGSNLD